MGGNLMIYPIIGGEVGGGAQWDWAHTPDPLGEAEVAVLPQMSLMEYGRLKMRRLTRDSIGRFCALH
jgi:hypothetical protein